MLVQIEEKMCLKHSIVNIVVSTWIGNEVEKMWESPINVIQSELMMRYEDGVMKAVRNVGFDVSKEELVKALQYDREQYDKGYKDAIEEFAEQIVKRIEEEIALLKHERAEAIEYDDEQVIFAINNQLRAFDYSLRVIAESMKREKE